MSQKPYVSEVVLALGAMEVVGAVFPPKITSSEEKLVSVCPGCEDTHQVEQFYQCPDVEEHTFKMGELDKAKDVDGTLVRVSAEEAAAARESELPKNVLDINVHAAEEILGKTIPSGTTYVYRPKTGAKFYGVLIDLIQKRPDLVFMGHMNLRGKDKFMKVSVALNGQLVLTEMMWPEEVDFYSSPEKEYKESLLPIAEQIVDQAVAPFDPDSYKKVSKERMAALVEAKASGAPAPKKVTKSKVDDDDALEAMLLASLEQAKAS